MFWVLGRDEGLGMGRSGLWTLMGFNWIGLDGLLRRSRAIRGDGGGGIVVVLGMRGRPWRERESLVSELEFRVMVGLRWFLMGTSGMKDRGSGMGELDGSYLRLSSRIASLIDGSF